MLTAQSSRRLGHRLAAALGLVVAACGSDDDSGGAPRPRRRPHPKHRPARRRHRGRRDQLVAHPEQRPGKADWQGDGRRLHGRAPEREDQHHRDGERGVQSRIQTNLQAGDVPDLFQSWGGGGLRDQVEAGLARTSPTRPRASSVTSTQYRAALPGRRQAVRRAVQRRHGGLLVQQGPSPRPGSTRHRPRGTSSSPTSRR